MRIATIHAPSLINYLKSDPYNAIEKPIQYGVQYTLASGIICNLHYSEKMPDELSFTMQNQQANAEETQLIERFVSCIRLK
ncbi:conserved hypothetical protein [Xenorhabdus bovienii str. puntauvense]|uniref:Uncharacterized protein n=1 Tax=Xenorhabdus bovienii str. puntauvense TaxID=1398201 RepID=A0A077N0I1_XENBV|nr:hypothetical protein [Xenorhabdus bovienii]CDG95591.1 conserved hypothetical protein [Xenorhabdus bovienii str. puntauvense]